MNDQFKLNELATRSARPRWALLAAALLLGWHAALPSTPPPLPRPAPKRQEHTPPHQPPLRTRSPRYPRLSPSDRKAREARKPHSEFEFLELSTAAPAHSTFHEPSSLGIAPLAKSKDSTKRTLKMSLAAEHKRSVPRSSSSSNTLLHRTLARNLSTRSDSSSLKPKHSHLSILAHVLSPTAVPNPPPDSKRPSGLALSQYSSERKKKKKLKTLRHGPSCFALQHGLVSKPTKGNQAQDFESSSALLLDPTRIPIV